MELILEDIESIECIGVFQNEFVYDIEVETDDPNCHCFFANNILVHNTDSLYISYKPLIDTIENNDKLSVDEKLNILLIINQEFLDKHNSEYISEYYEPRFGKSVQQFELETIALSGIWLDVKKKYAQLLLWKDGKHYSFDNMELKNVGLEMKKPSYPKLCRTILKDIVTYLLINASDKQIIHKLNIRLQDWRKKWLEADIDDICANMSVNGYTKYVVSDKDDLIVKPKCPSNVRAMGNYNAIKNKHNIKCESLYSGKMKMYKFKIDKDNYDYFAYPAMEFPKWAEKYAPIDRNAMFQSYVIDPLNRIIEPSGYPTLNLDGSIQFSLF